MIKIEDNFLDQENFNKLQDLMMGPRLQWNFGDGISSKDDLFQFVHLIYQDHAPCSMLFQELFPLIEKIKPWALWRIKANLFTRTSNIIENFLHVDMQNISEEQMKQWTTSIFYVNTNNGYTKFEDGTTTESVANRMVTFPTNMAHYGSSCTDEKTRLNINFNYFSWDRVKTTKYRVYDKEKGGLTPINE